VSDVKRHFDEFHPGLIKELRAVAMGEALVISPGDLRLVALALKKDLGFDMLIDIAAVDFKGKAEPRFEVDYFFYNLARKTRVHIKVPVASSDKPEVDSITDLYPAANWAEREIWDMMGIIVNGHPNLRRILMWTGFEGHPLRKDYPINKRQPIPVLDVNLIPERGKHS
jgi:NADH-quinone oxidoreductase subunit C